MKRNSQPSSWKMKYRKHSSLTRWLNSGALMPRESCASLNHDKIKQPYIQPVRFCARYSIHVQHLLDGNGLGQVSWEIDVESLGHGKPVRHELQWNNIDQTLERV